MRPELRLSECPAFAGRAMAAPQGIAAIDHLLGYCAGDAVGFSHPTSQRRRPRPLDLLQ
jgi:hypothetical protein